jgi:DNA-binding transcriptional LysR family regulator
MNAQGTQPAVSWDDFRVFLQVARTGKVTAAAQLLSVDYTTVGRRIRTLEDGLGVVLFEKSKARGYELTAEGQRLLVHAEAMEQALDAVRRDVQAESESLAGHVRLGTTEGFGTFVLAPQLSTLQRRHPRLSIDLLPLPRFVSLSKREADIAVTIEPPTGGSYVRARLADYNLKVYATRGYLDTHPAIERVEDLRTHDFIGYVDELVFSSELRYLETIAQRERIVFRSTSVIAQYTAATGGGALAVLPCFLASPDPRLVPVLDGAVVFNRTFWIYCHEEQRKLWRVRALWDFLREIADANREFLLGGSPVMRYL